MSTPTPARDSGQPLLVVKDLRVAFRTDRGLLRALRGVSLTVAQGQTLGIVGESGSGKSVFARTVMNLLPPNAVGVSGEVIFDGRDTTQIGDDRTARAFWGTGAGIVFQDSLTALNPVRTIGRQMTDPLRYHFGLDKKAATTRARELLDQVGIPETDRRLAQYPHELSGGMRQRVTIAIALSCEPKLLIADEPTTALDVTVQAQILDLLGSLQRERNMALILITHDLGVIANHSDRVAVMYAGEIVESADTDDLFSSMRHHYTRALLAAIPRLDQPSHTKLSSIPGLPPNVYAEHPGCQFAVRCPAVQDQCRAQTPALVSDDGRELRCFFPLTGAAVAPTDVSASTGAT